MNYLHPQKVPIGPIQAIKEVYLVIRQEERYRTIGNNNCDNSSTMPMVGHDEKKKIKKGKTLLISLKIPGTQFIYAKKLMAIHQGKRGQREGQYSLNQSQSVIIWFKYTIYMIIGRECKSLDQ